jgi:hypothetical protein
MIDALLIMLLIVGLELILGIDNVLVIAILVERLPEPRQDRARITGLLLAMFARIGILWLVLILTGFTRPLFFSLSIRDIILISAGQGSPGNPPYGGIQRRSPSFPGEKNSSPTCHHPPDCDPGYRFFHRFGDYSRGIDPEHVGNHHGGNPVFYRYHVLFEIPEPFHTEEADHQNPGPGFFNHHRGHPFPGRTAQ